MYCFKCGAELKSEGAFCPSCGNRISDAGSSGNMPTMSREYSSEQPSAVTAEAPRKKRSVLPFILIVVGVAVAILGALFLLGDDIDKETEQAIATVKSGYLGVYDDAPIEQVLNASLNGGVEGASVEWSGGKDDEGVQIVQADCEYEGDKSVVQFKMLSESTFKVSVLSMPGIPIGTATELAEYLQQLYIVYYMDDYEIDEITEKLSAGSLVAVQYGASADYAGDRGNLYVEYSGMEVPITAAEHLGLLSDETADDSWNSNYDYSEYEGTWETASTSDDTHIQVTLYFTNGQNPVEYSIDYWNGWNEVWLYGYGYMEGDMLFFDGEDSGGNMVEGYIEFDGDEAWIESSVVEMNARRILLAFGRTYIVNLSSENIISPY